jgi:RNA polymerase sigma-70 factor (ECF subfamily)
VTAQRVGEQRDLRDPSSRAWVTRLTADGAERDEAVAELLTLLVRAARFVLVRRRPFVSTFPRETIDDLALEAAHDALVEILARLDDFRGESRFTTWAWKFACFEASEAVRRRSWMNREIPSEDRAWSALARELSPEWTLEQRELLSALKCGIECELTSHQRSVFVALALNEVPIDVLAERMGTTRGALYKTLHDARRRLRTYLAA